MFRLTRPTQYVLSFIKSLLNLAVKNHFFCYSQRDYVCFDVVPRHHNIIRYRRGLAVIKDDFHTVCSWVQFQNTEDWKYDLFLGIYKTECIFFFVLV